VAFAVLAASAARDIIPQARDRRASSGVASSSVTRISETPSSRSAFAGDRPRRAVADLAARHRADKHNARDPRRTCPTSRPHSPTARSGCGPRADDRVGGHGAQRMLAGRVDDDAAGGRGCPAVAIAVRLTGRSSAYNRCRNATARRVR